MDRPWLKLYPPGVPAAVDVQAYPSLAALLDECLGRHAERPALRYMGQDLRHAQLDADARALAAWLQSQGLARGDRVALMLPNVPQYAVAVAAVLRAGLVVVNVNPQHTAVELEHQLRDAGARAIVILEHFAATLEQVMPRVPVQAVLLASMGDMLGPLKGTVINHVARRVRHLVPAFRLPDAVRWRDAVADGRRRSFVSPAIGPDDIAALQYTGGTTSPSKAAVLLHRNLVANVLQSEAWYRPALARLAPGEQLVNICALPLHHIFAFTTCMLLGFRLGALNVLIPNPRDLPATIKTMAAQRFHGIPATDTLFQALASHPDIGSVDFGALAICIGGGMAVQGSTARLWLQKTGCPIVEGYGLSETSPSATCNPVEGTGVAGSIGLPLPGTDVVLLDDDGQPVPPGAPGEIAIRGPQVMAGYWQRPDETAKVMTRDGFFRSGDIGTMDEGGWLRIVDRKKDMILVSGFHVIPNEVEDVIARMPGVLECAAVGVPDARAGEAVKVVVVKQDPGVTERDVRAFCEANLSGYKRPKLVEFRSALPRTPVGKILRRELRDAA
jgi:long-chain acyl-CoA synthetase